MADPLFWKIKHAKDKFHEKVNEELRDRVRHEAKDTLRIIQRLKSKGHTSEKILRDILKYEVSKE